MQLFPNDFGEELLLLACRSLSVLWRCWLGSRKGIRPVKNWVVECLGWGADLHIAQQMPLQLAVSCSSKSRLVLTFLVLPFWYLLTRVVPDIFQKSSKTVCVCVTINITLCKHSWNRSVAYPIWQFVSLSLCPESVLCQNGWLDQAAISGGERGQSRDGCIKWEWWSSKRGTFGSEFGASHPIVTNGTLLHSCARATHSSQITLGKTCCYYYLQNRGTSAGHCVVLTRPHERQHWTVTGPSVQRIALTPAAATFRLSINRQHQDSGLSGVTKGVVATGHTS